ncbi:MAG TPA: hypothetical protein DCM26_00620, partial [Desulfotomaculum sp.]|nr:hypothetical protein [Desulfotomaculum sp.]
MRFKVLEIKRILNKKVKTRMLKKKKLYFWLSLVLISSLVLLPLTAQAGWEQFHTDAAHVGATGDTSYPGVPSLIWMQGPWTVSGKTYEAVPSSSVTVGVYGSKTRVFVSCRLNTDKNEGLLMCLDASDGSQLWHAPVKGNNGSNDSWTSPTYHDGRVFIAGSKIYCYHADGENYSDNQKLIWDYDTTDGTVDNNPTKAWNGAVNGCPAISNNVVVVGDYTKPGEYHFIRESDGHPLGYSIPTDPDNNGYYCQGTPALAGGKAYLTAWTRNAAPYYRGHVWCVNLPSTGGNQGELTTLWSVYKDQNNNNLKSTCGSAVYYSDKLYVTTYNFDGVGDLYSLNPVNGNINWRSEVQRTDCTPSVETVNGNVYVYVCGGCRNYSNLQSHCYKDNGGSAELVWQTSTADEIGSYTCSPAVTTSDGKVFIGKSASGGLYFDYKGIFALNRSNGNKIWSFNHGGAAPAAYNGTIFTIAEGRVYAFGTSPNSKYDITDNDFSVGEKTYVTIEGTGDEANVRLSGSSGSQLDQSQTTSGGYTYQPGEVLDQSQTNYIGALNTDDNAQICWKNTGNPKFK